MDIRTNDDKIAGILENIDARLGVFEKERAEQEAQSRADALESVFVTKEDLNGILNNFGNRVEEVIAAGFSIQNDKVDNIQKAVSGTSEKVVAKTQTEGRSNYQAPSDENLQTAYDQQGDKKDVTKGKGNDGGDEMPIVLKEGEEGEDEEKKKKEGEGGDSGMSVEEIESRINGLQKELKGKLQKDAGVGLTGMGDESGEEEGGNRNDSESTARKKEKKDDEDSQEDKQTIQMSAGGADPVMNKAGVSVAANSGSAWLDEANRFPNWGAQPDPMDNDKFTLDTLAAGSNGRFADGAQIMKELHEMVREESAEDLIPRAARWIANIVNEQQDRVLA